MTGFAAVRVDPAPPAGWDDLAAARGSFYHATAWLEGIGALFRYRLRYLSVMENGTLRALLPLAVVPTLSGARRLVSFPFSYAAGTVGDDGGCRLLLARAIEEARSLRCRRLEVKSSGAGAVEAGFERVVHYRSYRVPTAAGLDPVWSSLNADSTRRGIRKAERGGVVARLGGDVVDWTAMARLQEDTSREHGTPPPPRAFFVDHARGLSLRGLADLWLAFAPSGGDPIAGIVIWKGPREWVYSFGASRSASLPLRPNHLLLWRAFQAAAAAGVDINLGRAAPEQGGLVQFKVRWGGQPVDLQYDYWPTAGGLNVSQRDRGPLAVAAKVWRRLPAPIARWGSRLYRYLG